ncbi:MAG: hypothetical protein ACOC4Y_01940 [bacterium]
MPQVNVNCDYLRAIDLWGAESQLLQAVEECNELSKAIIKYLNRGGDRENVKEEIADVDIMLGQLKCLFSETDIEDYKEIKLNRLRRLMAEETQKEE